MRKTAAQECLAPEKTGGHARKMLLCGASAFVVAIMASPAFAQSNAPAADEAKSDEGASEIVVTGIRGSLQKSLDIKRNTVGVVDAISAEDIGKFPDSNMAAAMMRIPGVTVSRGSVAMSSTSAGTSLGDANQVTVRGFGPSFNTTLFDGRTVATATGDRGYNFGSVGADFVGEVDVMKTPDSRLSAGAIGATVNVKYPKPFDKPGLRFVVSASGSLQDESGRVTPTVGALISDTFADDTFGILVDAMYTDHRVQTNHVNVQGWSTTTLSPAQMAGAPVGASTVQGSTNYWYVQDYGVIQEKTREQRIDGRLVLQWRPSDNVQVTLNDNYSRDHINQFANGFSAWFWAPGSDGYKNVTLSPNGTITSFINQGSATDFQSQNNQAIVESNEFGGNVKWDASDNFTLELDGDHSISKLNPDGTNSAFIADVGYGGTNSNNLGLSGLSAGGLPFMTNYGPSGNAARLIDPTLMGSHVMITQSMRNVDKVDQFKMQGTWKGERVKLSFGAQYVNDVKNLQVWGDQQNGQVNAFAGYGPASGSTAGVRLPASLFSNSFSTANFIPGFANSNSLPAQILAFDPYAVLNYLQGLGNPQTTPIAGFNTTCCSVPYKGTFVSTEYLSSHQRIAERTVSGFVNLALEESLGDMPLFINAGVRYESTKIESSGIGSLPTSLAVVVGDPSAYQATFPANPTLVTGSNSYQYLLPNLDVNLFVTDKLKLRFNASRTLTRPPLSALSPVLSGFNLRVGGLTASGGNPRLQPYLSDNLDLGAEWYYAKNSYLSVGVFMKNVTNFIVGGTVQQSVNGVVLPGTTTPAIFNVTSQVNGPTAIIRGAEIAMQHVFGDSGFGFQANATFVGTNKPYDPKDLSQSGFAVTGIGKSANFVGFYDKNGFQARIAVNWRGEYLDHFGQLNAISAYGAEPTFVNANTQIDFSTSYDLTKNITVYASGTNLNNSTFSTHGRFKEQFLDAVKVGRRFTVGARYKF